MRWLAALALVAGCDVPPPSLHIRFAGPPTQACPSEDCTKISLSCKSMMSIRIADPNDTTAPYLSQCTEIGPDAKHDACAVAHVKLDATPLPVRDLEVQVAVYPLVIDPVTQLPACPAKVEYDRVWGFPIEQDKTPALGGRAFYHPGDNEVVVTLGCTDVTQLSDETCAAPPAIAITASVDDFETIGYAVGTNVDLHVFVGEPTMAGSRYVLLAPATRELMRTVHGPTQSWSGDVDLAFGSYICLEVLENMSGATSVLRCKKSTAMMTSYDLPGVYLSIPALGEILDAVGPGGFPSDGITIGIVVDESGNPLESHTIATETPFGSQVAATVKYLANDRKTVIAGGLTSKSGVFVSTDAPFGTQFSTSEAGHTAISAIGGLVAGKVTLVVLQFDHNSTTGP